MDKLKEKSDQLQSITNLKFERYLSGQIDWTWRLNGILGARGTGKSTMMLQRLKREFGTSRQAIYISMDDMYFMGHTLTDFIEMFRNKGGKYLFIDEVHKYKSWSIELKNIYDLYPDLHIVFSGSSIINILRESADLSRRAVVYHMNGLSFREYLSFIGSENLYAYSLEEIVTNHTNIAAEIIQKINPLEFFSDYLMYGYYPYFIENKKVFFRRLEQTLNLIIEGDLNFIDGFDTKNIPKLKQLLYILSVNAPFKPNIVNLSAKTAINRNTLVEYIHYLEKAQVINAAYPAGISTSTLQKPEKIFLNNTSLAFMLAEDNPDKGNLRETFFMSQLKASHNVKIPKSGDFEVDGKYLFEIGGKMKSGKQIKGNENAYVVADDVLTGSYNKIPLWLFGFLY